MAESTMAKTSREAHAPRLCISVPPPEVTDAARYLDAAVAAHLHGRRVLAEELIRAADMPEIYGWLKPIWADSDAHLVSSTTEPRKSIDREQRALARMPTRLERQHIHQRDGYTCRFCGMQVVRPEIRDRIRKEYPNALRWGRKESEQHAAFQAMWAQYDHVVPHAHGGTNDLANVILACAACNFARGGYLLEDVGVQDPRRRAITHSTWDGLERFARHTLPSNNSLERSRER
jgi:hypothetical protein